MRQLSAVEKGRAVSRAQQEAGSLARALHTQQDSHRREFLSLETQTRGKLEEAERKSSQAQQDSAAALEQLQQLREEAERQAGRQAERMVKMEEVMTQTAQEASRQLAEARSSASDAVISVARQQVEAAHSMAVSVASAAAREAVTAAMRMKREMEPSQSSHVESRDRESGAYASDFEHSGQTDSLGEGESVQTAQDDQTLTASASQSEPTGHSSHDSSLTPVPSGVEVQERRGGGEVGEEGGEEGEEGGGEEGEEDQPFSESQTSAPEEDFDAAEEVSC